MHGEHNMKMKYWIRVNSAFASYVWVRVPKSIFIRAVRIWPNLDQSIKRSDA